MIAHTDLPPLRSGSLAARVCLWSGVVVAPLLVLVILVVPELWVWVLLGGVFALLCGAVGAAVLSRAAAVEPGDPRNGMLFMQALVVDFAAQFGGVILGMLTLHLLGVKFAQLAAFGITFAGVALAMHVVGAIAIGRVLGQLRRGASKLNAEPR